MPGFQGVFPRYDFPLSIAERGPGGEVRGRADSKGLLQHKR